MTGHRFDHAGSQLRIERFRAQYLVAADHPAPERVKARLDGFITDWLPEALGTALAGALPETSPDVWKIRRLHLDLDVNVAWDRDTLLKVLAERASNVLMATIRGGSDGRDVMWFPDRAAYLASFLADRAEGRGDAWYYDTFEGLRLLPMSAALRTAICEAPETGLTAMRRLAPEVLRRVVLALTVQDARTVLDVFASEAPAGDPARCIEAAWSAWQSLLGTALLGGEERDSLRLYLAAIAPGTASGPPLRDAARAVVRLDRLLRDGDANARARLLSALSRIDPSAIYLAAGASDAEVLAPWRAARREWLREVIATLASRTLEPTSTKTTANEPRSTRFGGIFLLLPILDELPLDRATASWPDMDGTTALSLARFLILVKCLGSPRALALFHDEVLRDLMGIAPNVSTGMCFEWQSHLSNANRDRFQQILKTWQVERGILALETQFLVRISRGAGSDAVLIDGERGIWRRIVQNSQAQPDRVIRRLRNLVPPGSHLLCDAEFVAPLCREFPDHRVTAFVDFASEDDAEAREILTRLDHLPDDLAYLHFPPQVGMAGALDRVLSAASQSVLRAFAWRLPGFSRSSLAYLHTNFLDVPATLEDQPERRIVLLGQPPLGVILNMTGLSRGSYRLKWLDERPFVLFPET